MYKEQVNLTWFSIKNKLFKITKVSKEFQFQQRLQIEFTKSDEIFKEKVFADSRFDSGKIEINNIIIDKLLNIQHNQLSLRVERETYGGSGCTIYSILEHQLNIVGIVPLGPCVGYPPATQPHWIVLFSRYSRRFQKPTL